MSEQHSLGIKASIELIERLQETITDFAQRENALIRAIGLNIYTFEKQRDESLEILNTQLETQLESASDQVETLKEHAQNRFEKRQQWIDQAWKNSRQKFLQELEESEGHRKYSIQKTMLETEKDAKTALSLADSDFEDFQEALRQDRIAFKSLAALATKSLRGYASFSKALTSGLRGDPDESPTDRPPTSGSETKYRNDLHHQLQDADVQLLAFRRHLIPRLFSVLPLSLVFILIALLHLPIIPLLNNFGIENVGWQMIAISAAGFMAGAGALHLISRISRKADAAAITNSLTQSRQLLDRCEQTLGKSHQRRRSQIKDDYDGTTADLDDKWKDVLQNSAEKIGRAHV